jgi:hypothetical protein
MSPMYEPSTEEPQVQRDDDREAEQEARVAQAIDDLRRAFRTDPEPSVVRHHLAVVREHDNEALVDLTGGEPVLDLTDEAGPEAGTGPPR